MDTRDVARAPLPWVNVAIFTRRMGVKFGKRGGAPAKTVNSIVVARAYIPLLWSICSFQLSPNSRCWATITCSSDRMHGSLFT